MSTPLLENILNQPAALAQVTKYQCGEGRKALETAASLLQSKRRILLSGMGASLFASIPFQYALAARGIQAIAIETAELLHSLESWINADTAIVLISRSGESVEVTKILPKARAQGAAIIGIVNIAESTLARTADQAIVLNSPADQMVAIQSYTATSAVFALLDAALGGELDVARQEALQLAEIGRSWIPACVDASTQWQAFANSASPVYLLGRGAALGTVAEGVLLMHETAKAPAVGMSAAQFRHGPVEVVDEHFRALLIATQETTRALDKALATDLRKMGGEVRWIGPANSTQALMEWPDNVPDRFLSVAEIIPLQILAYRKAEWKGIRPGAFRWAPLVTTSEAGF